MILGQGIINRARKQQQEQGEDPQQEPKRDDGEHETNKSDRETGDSDPS
jgi:hypothetical protein